MRTLSSLAAIAALVFSLAVSAQAESATSLETAKNEELAAAIGHYSRARSLLIAAIREFDAGKRIASPDVIINSAEWRGTLLSRSEELERVLDPQPRTTKGGVRYQSDSRLLVEAGQR